VLGCSALSEIVAAVDGAMRGEKPMIFSEKNAPVPEIGRIPTTPPFYAYDKISEGCETDIHTAQSHRSGAPAEQGARGDNRRMPGPR